MPATLVIPHECLEHLDQFDRLMDIVHDLGGCTTTWGPCLKPTTLERVWISVTGLPGRDSPLQRTGSTLNQAAWAIMQYEWPDPQDEADTA